MAEPRIFGVWRDSGEQELIFFNVFFQKNSHKILHLEI